MRVILATVAVSLFACSGEHAGAEEARRQAEAEFKDKVEKGVAAKKISPPVPGQSKLSCDKVIDLAAFQTAIGEKEPLTAKDVTKGDAEAAASCDLIRGGKKMSDAEQQALLKKEGRLGVLAGDVVCNVTTYCYTIEDAERFKKRCAQRKDRDDDTMGSYACVQVVATGKDDVQVFRFFDEDTKCILQVRGGPSNTDNDLIRNCAKTARDTIGPAQIAVTASGSGS